MNKRGSTIVETPYGQTQGIDLQRSVKQGTVFRTKLCSIVTDQVNKISETNITLIRDIEIEALVFVDDIMFATCRQKGIETAVNSYKAMKQLKGFTFNTGKEKSAVLTIGREQTPTLPTVKREKIENVEMYKYPGESYSKDMDRKQILEQKKNKVNLMIATIKKYGDPKQIGIYAMQARLKIYKSVTISTLFHNRETWTTMPKTIIEEQNGTNPVPHSEKHLRTKS